MSRSLTAVPIEWSKRLFLEAWHSIRDPNAISEHIYIPDIYKALGQVTFLRLFRLYSILTKTFLQKSFLVSDNDFISYYRNLNEIKVRKETNQLIKLTQPLFAHS